MQGAYGMIYALFSDIHSNLEAFESLCADFSSRRIDAYIFLGDIVGYGANPRECIALLKKLNPMAVAGNHDWASCGRLSVDYFNRSAREAILWTKKELSNSDSDYLEKLSSFLEIGRAHV